MTYHKQSECPHCNGWGWEKLDDRFSRCMWCKPDIQLPDILANQAFDDEFHQELNEKLTK